MHALRCHLCVWVWGVTLTSSVCLICQVHNPASARSTPTVLLSGCTLQGSFAASTSVIIHVSQATNCFCHSLLAELHMVLWSNDL